MQKIVSAGETAVAAAVAAHESAAKAKDAVNEAFPPGTEQARDGKIVRDLADHTISARDALLRFQTDIKQASSAIRKLNNALRDIEAGNEQAAVSQIITHASEKPALASLKNTRELFYDAISKLGEAKTLADEAVKSPAQLGLIVSAKSAAEQAERETSRLAEVVKSVHDAIETENPTDVEDANRALTDAYESAHQCRSAVDNAANLLDEAIAMITPARAGSNVSDAAEAAKEALFGIRAAKDPVESSVAQLQKLQTSLEEWKTISPDSNSIQELRQHATACATQISGTERFVETAVVQATNAVERASAARDTPAANLELLRVARDTMRLGPASLGRAIDQLLALAKAAEGRTGLGLVDLHRLRIITDEADRMRIELTKSAEALQVATDQARKAESGAKDQADQAQKALKGVRAATGLAVDRTRAAEDAELLIEYAARHSVEKITKDDQIAIINYARAHGEGRKPSTQEEANFWSAYNTLTTRIKPATVESVRERLAFDRELNIGSLGRAGVASSRTLIMILVITLLVHMYFSVLESLINNAETSRANFTQIKSDLLQGRIEPGDAAARMCEQEYAWRGSLRILGVWTILLSPQDILSWRQRVPGEEPFSECPWLENKAAREADTVTPEASSTVQPSRNDALASEAAPQANTATPEASTAVQPSRDEALASEAASEANKATREAVATAQLSGDDALLVKAVALRSVISQFFLPLLYGWLGALAYGLRTLANEMRSVSFSRATRQEQRMRVPLGILAGATVGLLIKPDTLSTVQGVTSIGIAFGLGFAVDLFFDFLEGLMLRLKGASPATVAGSGAQPQKNDSGP